ncbi:MAG: TonB-dependent receptor [Xanthomonadales bacterium]|nr:TonB-dependent receptor [Xanthomonadales bacterium]
MALCCALLFSFPAQGQDKVGEEAAAGEEEQLPLEHVLVIGSHLKRTDFEGPAPVVVVTREDLEATGVNLLDDYFRYLPQNVGLLSEGDRAGFGFAGASAINLRGIGVDATLTLINGRRVSSYGNFGSGPAFGQGAAAYVDISAIPVALIDRVEILKDGASALYGADAVAGVVNIVLRKNFVGSELNAGYLTTSEGDGDEMNVDLLWGNEWGNSSLMVSLSFLDKEPVAARDRESNRTVDFSDQGGPDFRAFNSSPSSWLNYDTFEQGIDPDCGIDPNVTGPVVHPFFGPLCLYNYNWFTLLTDDSERYSASLNFGHEFDGDLRFYAEAFYTTRDNHTQFAPTPVIGTPVLPTLFGFPVVPPDHPQNPEGAPLEIFFRVVDAGLRNFESTADAWRTVLGLEGKTGEWEWNAALAHSGNDVDTTRENAVLNSRFQLALLGLGGPDGNLYYNPFGADQNNPPELLDWLTTEARFGSETEETELDLQATTLFGDLPGGPVGLALGLQYREQSVDQFANEAQLSGDITGGAPFLPLDADRDVLAAYMELSVPVLPEVEVQLAARYEDYSDFGDTTNPKVAIRWQPVPSLLLRGSWGTSFQAPAFPELFRPAALSSNFYRDVERCEVTNDSRDCDFRLYNVLNSGNPDLQPEEGESVLFGLVWSPDFWDGFSIQLDWWQFEHDDRIVEIDPQVILDEKGNVGITRAPPSDEDIALGIPGPIIEVLETFYNTDEFRTSGIDVAMVQSWDTDTAGEFIAMLQGTYVSEYELSDTRIFGAVPGLNYAGRYYVNAYPVPRWKGNLNVDWNRGSHGASALVHYIGDYRNILNIYRDGVETDQPWIIGDRVTFDFQYRYTFEGLRGAEMQLGCQNCFDQDPPVTFTANPEYFHDPRGLLFYLRWRQPF